MKKIKMGVIADDFTGASDAASFLVKGGNNTILLTEIPTNFNYECDCVVVALKVRSVEPNVAISKVCEVLDFFEKISVEKIYFKYCSTFDSTPKGNIGVILDYILERTNSQYSVLCPSLPVNGRKVKDGILYVNDVPLAESPMKNHPLNPMWDSYIPNLMKDQSKYSCFILKESDFDHYEETIKELNEKYKHYYLVPDYSENEHGVKVAEMFSSLKVLSGGSGLLEFFSNNSKNSTDTSFDVNSQKALIVCGSCSAMTNKQVQKYKSNKNPYISIDSSKLLTGEIKEDNCFEIIKKNFPLTTLVYSDGCEGNLKRGSKDFFKASQATEDFLSSLAKKARDEGFNKIIVAGGETSGAVTIKLGYSAFHVGKSVAPGVPILMPVENNQLIIILKSGNFGDEDFFERALEAK